MIKRCGIQAHDVRVSPFVLSVTITTGAPGVQPSMKPGVYGYIPGHLLVTAQTKINLLVFFERNVTLATIGFDIGMAPDDLTGHDQSFQVSRANRA